MIDDQPQFFYSRNNQYFREICIIDDESVNKTSRANPGPGAYESPSKNPRYKASPMYGLGSAKRQ